MEMTPKWIAILAAGFAMIVFFEAKSFSAEAKNKSVGAQYETILANQERILQSLEEIRNDLRIVKVRASS